MQGEFTAPYPSLWRRAAAALALLCYLFAATLGAVSHSQAMARLAGPASENAADSAEHGGHDHAEAGGHGAGHDDHAPAPATTPCEQNCILCQSCSPSALLVAQPHSGEVIAFAYAIRYAMPTAPMPAGHIGALPSEPPRV